MAGNPAGRGIAWRSERAGPTAPTARLLTAGIALLACLAATAAIAPPARAQSQESGTGSTASRTWRFDIPAKPLPQAIADFSAITGMQVLYTEAATYDHQAPALSGSFTAGEAMGRLLDGSGLAWRTTPTGALTIERAGGPAPSQTSFLKPITVYGAKNSTVLGDSTASVAVVTAEEIERHELRDLDSTFRMMGNVLDGDWNDAGFVIRGINSEGLTPGGQPLASIYVDGTQQTVQGARRGASGLWDVEQVEVYRGPQSTLSGRAALAGAVYVKTKDPVFDWESKAQATVGTLHTYGGAATVNAPVLKDQVALRLSAEYEQSKSDLHYPTYEAFDRYDDFVHDTYYQVRGKALFLPNALPDTSALLTYSFAHDAPTIDDIAGPGLGFSYDDRRGDFNLPVFTEVRSSDTHNASLEIQHDLEAPVTLTSLTSYSFTDLQRPSINEGTAGETNVTEGYFKESIASQEFRANYDGVRLTAVAGIYLAQETSKNTRDRPNYFGRTTHLEGSEDLFNAAAFGEAVYEVIPTWKVVAGGRLDYVDRRNSTYSTTNGAVVTDTDTSNTDLVPLPKLGLIKELAPGHSLGFTVQRAFRTGGAGANGVTGQTFTYKPEYAWNYEASYRGSFLADRLQVAANVFYMDWSDQQVEVQQIAGNFNSNIITNAASSTVKGFELDSRFTVNDQLTTFASIGYVDTQFREFVDANLGDLSGLSFPEAPKWNIAVGGTWEAPNGLFIGADAKYLSSYLSRLDGAPFEYLDAYIVANMQAGYRGEGWDLTLWAENLFDNDYFTYEALNAADQGIAATLGPRRVFGATVTARF
ncbi:TonB-dependent receptor domain-containing protein [Marinibaculum pumilum]|uniref:TonB-dependent receptor domain-containing protein n=1 Tax=Marinibaculum pumilum TaxID=1766165 RepID=A0ABV7L4W4_9PROT